MILMILGWYPRKVDTATAEDPIRCTVAGPSSSLVSYMDQIEGLERDLTEVISGQLGESRY